LSAKIDRVIINPASEKELLIGKKPEQRIILEEFPMQVDISKSDIDKCAEEIANAVYKSTLNVFLKEEFKIRFVILPEKSFSYFVKYATEVVPNIKIDDTTGTSTKGLRYTEYLPSETILYSLMGFEKPRMANSNGTGLKDAQDVKTKFITDPPGRIQIGADETKGKGFVELSILHNEGAGNG
jgi:CRISPR-associated protein Cmr4